MHLIKNLHGNRNEIWMGHPSAIMTCFDFSKFVVMNFG